MVRLAPRNSYDYDRNVLKYRLCEDFKTTSMYSTTFNYLKIIIKS